MKMAPALSADNHGADPHDMGRVIVRPRVAASLCLLVLAALLPFSMASSARPGARSEVDEISRGSGRDLETDCRRNADGEWMCGDSFFAPAPAPKAERAKAARGGKKAKKQGPGLQRGKRSAETKEETAWWKGRERFRKNTSPESTGYNAMPTTVCSRPPPAALHLAVGETVI